VNDKLADLPTRVLVPVLEGFKDSFRLSKAIVGSVASVISSFSSHQERGQSHTQQDHPHVPHL